MGASSALAPKIGPLGLVSRSAISRLLLFEIWERNEADKGCVCRTTQVDLHWTGTEPLSVISPMALRLLLRLSLREDDEECGDAE